MTGCWTLRIEAHAQTRIVPRPQHIVHNSFPFLKSWGGACRTFVPRMADPSCSRAINSTPVRSQPSQVFRLILNNNQFELTVLSPEVPPQNCGVIKMLKWDPDAFTAIFYTELDSMGMMSFECLPQQVVLGVLPMECSYDIKIQTLLTTCTRLDKNNNPGEYFSKLAMAITSARPAPRSSVTPVLLSIHYFSSCGSALKI